VVIPAGGRGSHLKHHTVNQAKPTVPIAGKFRAIGFSLSNGLNCGIRRIGVTTQDRSHISPLAARRRFK